MANVKLVKINGTLFILVLQYNFILIGYAGILAVDVERC